MGKPALNVAAAQNRIIKIIHHFKGAPIQLQSLRLRTLKSGKVYELLVLAKLMKQFKDDHFDVWFIGQNLVFRTRQGPISNSDPHFEIRDHNGQVLAEVYVDIVAKTNHAALGFVTDYSSHHEIDIVVVDRGTTGNPTSGKILLAVECKGTAKFDKRYIREIMGLHRSMATFHSKHPRLPALPFSLRWWFKRMPLYLPYFLLAFLDPAGAGCQQEPATFGIELRNYLP